MRNKKLSFTVGIPTYYGAPSIINTAKSILASKDVDKFRFIINVDGNPLSPQIENKLSKLGVEVVFAKERGGQVARIKQMISMTKTDVLVLTQDDILFDKDTLKNVISAFRADSKLTMVSGRLKAIPAKTFFENVVEVGVHLTHRVGDLWKDGDNYLLSSGRLIAFKTSFVKKLNIPVDVINSDAYLYFENKTKDGRFKALKNVFVYNKSPQTLKEQLKQSRKFQYSREELTHFIKDDLNEEYRTPKTVITKALISEFLVNPFYTACYLIVSVYTHVAGEGMYSNAKRFWDTDVSTKKI